MASATSLEERFNAAVKTIQNLPARGVIQPSNSTKLTFYGLYKQATLGPCKDSRPSMFNYVARAKWEAWNRCQALTKEQAMSAYIDEIGKIVKAMPQTSEVLEFAQFIGLSNELVDDQSKEKESVVLTEKQQHQTTKENTLQSSIIDITENVDDYKEDPLANTNNPIETLVSDQNGSDPSSSSTSSSSSSMTSSDIDELYDDPSGFISVNHEQIISNNNHNIQQQSISPTRYSSHVFDNQNGTNFSTQHLTRNENNHTNVLTTYSSNEISYSILPVVSSINNRHHTTNDYNKETQRAILNALTKLQLDINNILERLNRLETSAYLLQQRELSTSLELNSSSRWLPLSGFRREMATITSGGDHEHLGIPKAVFVDDVDSFMQQPENDSADTVIRRLDDLNSKYRFMEMNLLQKKKRLRGKLPDIQICLDMIEQLRKYRETDTNMETNFLLAHNLYGKATILPTDKVCLWLGANVMLEYTLDEADELLRGNQRTAQTTLQKVDEDLDFLRDQITTTEVNMARSHNWAVKQKQQQNKK
ncbi:unnamed protein product [Rotaria sp. Silwood2]|nr:unnamed protein product [Rotaria sp. Silwood2]CAF4267093.1 unnamed protein product [Rotaria sp. Silwood2]